MRKPRLHVGWVLTGCFLLIIAIMGANTLIMQRSYDRFLTEFSEAHQQLIRLIDVKEDLRVMYESAASMTGASTDLTLPTLEKQYQDAYEHAVAELNHVKSQAEPQGKMYYLLTDILNMFDSFHARYEYYLSLRKDSYELIYLRQERNTLSRLRSYIEDELSAAYAYRTLEAKGAYDRSVRDLSAMRGFVIAILCAMATLCLMMAIWVSRAVSRPIGALAERMRAYERSGIDPAPTGPRRAVFRELGELMDSFDAMIRELHQKQVITEELSRQQMDNLEMKSLLQRAELDMLQMQMNPHFLFNTLNAIGALTQMEDAPRAGEMVERLSSILRHSMTALTQYVSLESETRIVADYIAIQQTRFGGRPLYREEIDPDAAGSHIPCMLIQPLIENAVLHAFPNPRPTDEVRLIAQRTEGGLMIVIADNGIGMDQATIDQLLSASAQIPDGKDERRGIGLFNVVRRMNILYGEGHVTITVVPRQGTRIALLISQSGTPPHH